VEQKAGRRNLSSVDPPKRLAKVLCGAAYYHAQGEGSVTQEYSMATRGNSTTDSRRRTAKKRPRSGVRVEIFAIDEGAVVLQWPDNLSSASFEDFESWLKLVLRKARRSIRTVEQEEDDGAG
jgi:hypothetical protein